jgi:predicted phage gp36 major capsid-like protein
LGEVAAHAAGAHGGGVQDFDAIKLLKFAAS